MALDSASSRRGPVFLLADDDRPAADAITGKMFPECYFIVQVTNPRHVRNYAKRLAPEVVFLAEPLTYPGGTETLLRRLVEDPGIPVIVLSEVWSPQVSEHWKKRGALDCLPHPTRFSQRFEMLRCAMLDLALAAAHRAEDRT